MKALLLVPAAFFLQSCYTILYTPNDYSATGNVRYDPHPGPVIAYPRLNPAYLPAPPPETDVPASASVPAYQQDARLRSNNQAGDQIYGTFPDQGPARIRTESAPANSTPAASNAGEARARNSGKANDGNSTNQNSARLRTPSQQAAGSNAQPAGTEARDRTDSRTSQNETPRPRSR